MTVRYTTKRPGLESLTFWPQTKGECERFNEPTKSFVFSSPWHSKKNLRDMVTDLGGTVVKNYSVKSHNRVVFHFPGLTNEQLSQKINYLSLTCRVPTTKELRRGPVTKDQAQAVSLHKAARTRLRKAAIASLHKQLPEELQTTVVKASTKRAKKSSSHLKSKAA